MVMNGIMTAQGTGVKHGRIGNDDDARLGKGMRIALFPLILGMTLAGCDSSDPATADPAPSPINASANAPASPSAAEALSAEIPDTFQGRWDSNPMACGQDVSEMRLIVAADGMRFYESVAKVDAVGQPGPDRIEVDAAVEAEGMTQGRHFTLVLRPDGRLATTIDGATAVRVRCEDGAPQ
jgi:hypothetical protein